MNLGNALRALGERESGTARTPGGIAGAALLERPSPLFLLFFHKIYSHR
jgi:hypothetical protein